MGAFFNGKCYATNAEAADAFFLSQGPSYTAGSTSYLSWFEKSTGGVWQIKRQSIASGGAITNLTTSNATIPTFTACDEAASFVDGITVGWGIAAAMVSVWAFRLMQRAAN